MNILQKHGNKMPEQNILLEFTKTSLLQKSCMVNARKKEQHYIVRGPCCWSIDLDDSEGYTFAHASNSHQN